MSNSTTMKEQLNTQLNAEKPNTNKRNSSNENEELIEREELKGSPFWIIGNKDEGYFLSFGKHRITELLKTKAAVKKHLAENQMDIILKMILAIVGEKEQITN